jgi:MFS family permease
MSRAPDSFYGWHVVFAAFIAQFVANFCTLSGIGPFMTVIEQEFSTDASAISNAIGASILLMVLLGPIVGRAIDRGNQRAIMLAGVFVMAFGLFASSRAETLWQLGLAFCVVVNLGLVMFGPMPSTALVSRWFVRRRGMAVAIAVAGATLASALSPVLAATLIETEGIGWRGALLWYAIGAALIPLPVFWLFVVKSPEELGQQPDGDGAAPVEPAAEGGGRFFTTRELLRDRNFLVIGIGMALLFTAPIVCTVHLIPYAEKDLGMDKQAAAFVFTVLALFSLVGKLVFGVVADRLHPRHALWIAVSLLVAGWGLLLGRPSYPMLLGIGALMGLGVGALGPLHAVVIGACFGRASFGHVMGLGGLVSLPIIAGSTPVVGWLAVSTQSYRIPFGVEVGCILLAGLLFAWLRLPGDDVALEGTPAAAGVEA